MSMEFTTTSEDDRKSLPQQKRSRPEHSRLCIIVLIAVLAASFITRNVYAEKAEHVEHKKVFQLYSAVPIKSARCLVFNGIFVDPKADIPAVQKASMIDKQPSVYSRPAVVKQLDENTWEIIAKLKAEDLTSQRKLAVVALTKSGRVIVGNTDSEKEDGTLQKIDIRCIEDDQKNFVEKLFSLNTQSLSDLVAAEKLRSIILQHKLKITLNTRNVWLISQLENRFGLTYSEPLSIKLPPRDLATRIGRLEALLRSK